MPTRHTIGQRHAAVRGARPRTSDIQGSEGMPARTFNRNAYLTAQLRYEVPTESVGRASFRGERVRHIRQIGNFAMFEPVNPRHIAGTYLVDWAEFELATTAKVV